ncbi:hypothetical protein LIER_08235 [Lithospermum erythrorhizon]|uniref:SWIM-type domain-containing protein n=1 Tax=Lithospermum erythrorhizon TaxID=34254 RepID=A0AAV3PF56_LITER
MADEDPVLLQGGLSVDQNGDLGLRLHNKDIRVGHSQTLGVVQDQVSDVDLVDVHTDGHDDGGGNDFVLSQTLGVEVAPLNAGNEVSEDQNSYGEGDGSDNGYSHNKEPEPNFGDSNNPGVDANYNSTVGYSQIEEHEPDFGGSKDPDVDQCYDSMDECSRKEDVPDLFSRVISGMDQEYSSICNYDRNLGFAGENPDLSASENHELAIVENHEMDENLELTEDQNNETAVVTTPSLPDDPSMFVFASPLQSRTLVTTETYDLSVGQEFPDVKSCRRALRNMAIANHFEIQTVKSDKTRFTAKCASEGCPWRVHAAKLPDALTFSIRTIQGEHTCSGIGHLGHQQASVEWIASTLEEQLKENPNCKPKEMLEEIHRTHGITLSYKQAWRGKERVMATLRGSFDEDYRLLPQYCNQIRRTNPGSMASVYVNPVNNCFQRLFISFQASIYGFINACRPLIGLDRTNLKNKYLSTLILATAFDGNGDIFPIAFGIVDEENDANWMWFLTEMRNLLETNTENMPRLTILSDRQEAITNAVEANFPTAFHGFCMRHLSETFRMEFNDTMLVNLFWEAANALTTLEYELKMHEIADISPDASYWLQALPSHLWANAYFKGQRLGHMTANIVESMNSWILEASSLPIVQMMECLRRRLMTWFNDRREVSMQWTSTLVPSAEMHVAEAIERARTFQVLRANEAEFEVISHEGTHIVDIRNRNCMCGGWQLQGLPCAHAVAALLSCRQTVHRYTESCFTIATYRKTYSQTIHPIPDRTLWKEISETSQGDGDDAEEIVVNPPRTLQLPGQPRKKRARSGEKSHGKRAVRCSRCNQSGHFRTTCVAPI